MMRDEVYLDYAATSPLDPAVVAVMSDVLTREFANPSSQHPAGKRARAVVEVARAQVAARVAAAPERLFFTSGATEANNLALFGLLGPLGPLGRRNAPAHFVTSKIEHKSVLDTARALERSGVAVSYVDADRRGVVAPDAVASAIRADTVLVSIMHVNNETGVIQDIAAIGALCRARGVRLHVDAAQSVGKLPLALGSLPVDLCSLTAHKLCGPKGVGALYVAPGVALAAQVHGGEQERGVRAGTLATHQIAGMGKAYEIADPDREGPRLAALRDELWERLRAIPGVRANGADGCAAPGDRGRGGEAIAADGGAGPGRAPHLLNVTFPGVEGESLRLAVRDLAVSAGSACAADSPEASHVLTAMGLSDVLAASSLRFSVGRFTTAAEVARAAGRVAEEVARLRALAPSAPAWCFT